MLLCGASMCEERWIPKLYETIGGCPGLWFGYADQNVDFSVDDEHEKFSMEKQQMNRQILYSLWILEVE